MKPIGPAMGVRFRAVVQVQRIDDDTGVEGDVGQPDTLYEAGEPEAVFAFVRALPGWAPNAGTSSYDVREAGEVRKPKRVKRKGKKAK